MGNCARPWGGSGMPTEADGEEKSGDGGGDLEDGEKLAGNANGTPERGGIKGRGQPWC